jgi:hypothetical protein
VTSAPSIYGAPASQAFSGAGNAAVPVVAAKVKKKAKPKHKKPRHKVKKGKRKARKSRARGLVVRHGKRGG